MCGSVRHVGEVSGCEGVCGELGGVRDDLIFFFFLYVFFFFFCFFSFYLLFFFFLCFCVRHVQECVGVCEGVRGCAGIRENRQENNKKLKFILIRQKLIRSKEFAVTKNLLYLCDFSTN